MHREHRRRYRWGFHCSRRPPCPIHGPPFGSVRIRVEKDVDRKTPSNRSRFERGWNPGSIHPFQPPDLAGTKAGCVSIRAPPPRRREENQGVREGEGSDPTSRPAGVQMHPIRADTPELRGTCASALRSERHGRRTRPTTHVAGALPHEAGEEKVVHGHGGRMGRVRWLTRGRNAAQAHVLHERLVDRERNLEGRARAPWES